MSATKQTILKQTHYGLDIYKFLLSASVPDIENVTLSNLTARSWINPLNQGKQTLRIKIEDGKAQHQDAVNTEQSGDAFQFAEQVLGKSGVQLEQYLVHSMALQVTLESDSSDEENLPLVSYYKPPVSNKIPCREVSLKQVAGLICSDRLKENTNKLRLLIGQKARRKYKNRSFPYITASGTFKSREDSALIKHSGLITLDFDAIPEPDELKQKLQSDQYFETQLAFTSPTGTGVKWIVEINLSKASHTECFSAITHYVKQTYNIQIDTSGSDVSRACYLCHDSNPIIHPKYA